MANDEDEDSELFLSARLEFSGPKPPVYGSLPEEYWCVYCGLILQLLPHEIRVCQSRLCLERAISDRKRRIFQLQLSVPRVQRALLDERQFLLHKIEAEEASTKNALAIAQWRALLASLNSNLNFSAKNMRVDRILAHKQAIRLLSARLRRRSFSDEYRQRLWERDWRQCYLCQQPIAHWQGGSMHIDHVSARSDGGSDEEHNLRISHPKCNLKKGTRRLEDRQMKAILQELRKSIAEREEGQLF